VRDRWGAAAKIASQLGGILNSAHHNDADRWTKGDSDRAEQLAQEFCAFLDAHPVAAVDARWKVTAESGPLPPRKRRPVAERTATKVGEKGQPLAALTGAACAAVLDTPSLAEALASVVVAAAADKDATGHVRLDFRDARTNPVSAATVIARRSDASGSALVVTVSV
jgi:hypothetical protein